MASPPAPLTMDTALEGEEVASLQTHPNPIKKPNPNPSPTNSARKSSPNPSPNKKSNPNPSPSPKQSPSHNNPHSHPNSRQQGSKQNPQRNLNFNQNFKNNPNNPIPNQKTFLNPNPSPTLSFALSIPAPPPAAAAASSSSSPSSSSSSSTYIYSRPLTTSPYPSSSSAAAAAVGGSPQFTSKSAMTIEEGRKQGGGKQEEAEGNDEEGNDEEKQGGKPIAGNNLKTSKKTPKSIDEVDDDNLKKKKEEEKNFDTIIVKDTKDNDTANGLEHSRFRKVSVKFGPNAHCQDGLASAEPPNLGAKFRCSSAVAKFRASCVGGLGQFTEFNPHDAWLPITTDSRGSGCAHLLYSSFHTLNAGIGFQGLLLPFAMFYLGWYWGIIALVIAYIWQLYTMWILIRLHESNPGLRYNRYVQLAQAAFGNRLGFWLATPPNINLTVGTSTTLIIIGGSTLKLFYKIVCGPECGESPLSTIEWYLVFAVLSMVLTQLPNLNSIVGLSLIGAVTAISYCILLWVLSITRSRPSGVSYGAEVGQTPIASIFTVLNALGIIAFSFRGHNTVMEIQATMPSTLKHPAHIPMWRGAKVSNAIIALCYLPIAIAGYWAYGRMMLSSGILSSVYAFHQSDISRVLMGFLFILVAINCLTGFQTYSFSIFDNFEAGYTAKCNRPISMHARVIFRLFYVLTNLLIGIAFPWVSGLTGMLGGLTSAPVTFAYPCFMWLAIKKPKQYSFSWYLNWTLGIVGMSMAVAFAAGGIWSIVTAGLTLHFFRAS